MDKELQELKTLLLDVKQGLDQLQDVDALQRLIVNYARGCDRGNDPSLIGPLFSQDGTWECKGFGKYIGRDKVAKGLHGIAGEKIWWSLHYMISPLIDIAPSGDSATGFWYLWEAATIPNEETNDAEAHWIGGTYDTEMVKRDGEWFFKSMELKLHMASGYDHGWVKKRFPNGTRKQPYFENLDAGSYHWCACGRSNNQPFCDGSHKETKRTPLEFKVEVQENVVLCGCKYSKTKPYCDGSHLNLNLDG